MSEDRDREELNEARADLRRVDDQLAQVKRELSHLLGEPCQRCSRREGDAIVGPAGEVVRLVGGYEAVLCRACRNAWAVAADESGHWLDYRKAVATAKATRDIIKAGVRAGHVPGSVDALEGAVNASVEALVAIERKLFQFAMKWLAEGTP